MEQLTGHDARVECRIIANPLANHYWMKDGKVIDNTVIDMQDGRPPAMVRDLSSKHGKYEMNIYRQNNNEFLTISALVIKVKYF